MEQVLDSYSFSLLGCSPLKSRLGYRRDMVGGKPTLGRLWVLEGASSAVLPWESGVPDMGTRSAVWDEQSL